MAIPPPEQPERNSPHTAQYIFEAKIPRITATLPDIQPLPRTLGTRDLVGFLIFDIVVLSFAMLIQLAGPLALFYWLIGTCTFFLPGAVVFYWLARHLPGQGSPYVWLSSVFNPVLGFTITFSIWLTSMLFTSTSLQEAIIYFRMLKPTWLYTSSQQGLLMILMLFLATAISCLPLARLKRLLFIACLGYGALYIILGASALWRLQHGGLWLLPWNRPATQPLLWHGQPLFYSFTILAFLGLNHPLFMGSEVHEGQAGLRRASKYIWWGAAIIPFLYLLALVSAAAWTPVVPGNETQAAVELWINAFGPMVKIPATLVLGLADIFQAVIFMVLFSRLLITLAQHHRLPPVFARINASGVPVFTMLVQAFTILVVMVIGFIFIPSLFEGGDNAIVIERNTHEIMLSSSFVLLLCSTSLFFTLPIVICFNRGKGKNIAFTVSYKRLVLITIALLGTGATLLAIWATLAQSWVAGISNEHWGSIILLIVFIMLILGWLCGELPRMNVLLSDQERVTSREKTLREQLQEAYQQQGVFLLELEKLYREQALAATIDSVTELPNHRAVMSSIDATLARARAEHSSFAIMFIDLDHFKSVNDQWGHRAGDTILYEVAQRLHANLRQEDFIGRYGGEEFALICTNSDLPKTRKRARQLCTILAERPFLCYVRDNTHEISVTASIGIAVYPRHGTTRDALIEQADRAMYLAKQKGRNRICCFS